MKMKEKFKEKSDNLSMSSNSYDSYEESKYKYEHTTDEEYWLECIY